MKKYFLLIVMIIPFLLPLDTYATEGFGAANVPWYANTSTDTALPLISGTRYRYQTFSPSSVGWYTTTFYAKINNTFTAGRFDYVLIDLWTQNGTGDDEITYYNDVAQYSTSASTTYKQDVVTVYLVQQNTSGGTQYLAPCYPLGQSKSDSIVYNLYCPIYSAATIVHSVKVETYISYLPGSGFTWTWGLSDWYSYHYSGADSNTLQQAIQSQTSEITDAQQETTDAINDLNDSLNDDSTTNAENTGSSFFSNFTTRDFGLTSVVTAPINFIQSFTNSCSANPVVMDIYGTDVTLPCGDVIFWNRDDVASFRIIWNLLIGGPIIYTLSLKLFRTVQRALDPDQNDEGGLDL